MPRKRSKTIDILLQEAVITPTQVEKAQAGIRTDCQVQSLISMGHLSDLRVLEHIISHARVPYVVLPNYRVALDVLAIVPEDYCRMNCVLPLERIDKTLTLAMVDPLDEACIKDVSAMAGIAVMPVLCSARDFADVAITVWLEAAGKKPKDGA